MELIQIIYDILLFGGTLLVCVIIISYLMSKSKTEEVFNTSSDDSSNQKSLALQRKTNYEQELFRKKIASIPPQIFLIDDLRPKEIKIIRKPTASTRDTQEEIRREENQLNKTNGNGKRYTIVNDEMKKTRIRAANFYL